MALNPATGSGEDLLRSALNKAELEALETLKLQYFQNATRYLAKGDYDSALAEIKRVLLIDPEHRLAREYEVRVSELQAARAQMPKAEPAPQPPREAPRVAAAAAVTVEAPSHAPAHRSKRTWLYLSLIAILLLGTAGVLSLEKADDEEQPAVAAVVPPPAPRVSTPVVLPVVNTVAEEPTPTIQVPPAEEPKHSVIAAEKSEPKPEPARKEAAPTSSGRVSTPVVQQPVAATKQPSTSAGIGLLAAVTEKKVDPPPAALPETKPAVPQPSAAEPAKESAPFVAVQQDPKIVHLEKPVLPEIVTRNHTTGSVVAKVQIDKNGKPGDVQILTSTSTVFEQPVIDAIGKSSFSPGMMGSGPVSAWVVIPFKFK